MVFLKKKFSTITIQSKSPIWLSWIHSHPLDGHQRQSFSQTPAFYLSRLYDLLFGIDFRVYWVEISSRHMCFSNFLLSLTLWTKNHYSIISLVYQFLTYPVLTPSLFHLQCTLMHFHKTSSGDNFTKNVNISVRSICQLCF